MHVCVSAGKKHQQYGPSENRKHQQAMTSTNRPLRGKKGELENGGEKMISYTTQKERCVMLRM